MNNIVNKEPTLIERKPSPSDCHLFAALERNHGFRVFQGDDVEKMAYNTGNGLISTGNRKAR